MVFFSNKYKHKRSKGLKCQHQNCETTMEDHLQFFHFHRRSSFHRGVPLIDLNTIYYKDTRGSFYLQCLGIITSIYHCLIYNNNSNIINSLQQNSKLLKVVLSNPSWLFCDSHAFLYHHLLCLSTFHVGFYFQRTIQNNIYKKRKTLLLHHLF
jgi:hypothetical protein